MGRDSRAFLHIPAHSRAFPRIPACWTLSAGVKQPFKLSLKVLFPCTPVPAWLSTFADEHLAAAASPRSPSHLEFRRRRRLHAAIR